MDSTMVRGGARLLVIGLIAVGCGGVGGQSVFDMEVGMCFDDVAGDEVTSVPTVDCSEPHDNEVFDIFDYTESEYPGQDAMNEAARQLCIDEFEAYVEITYQESELEVFAITPTDQSWEDGDREIICNLFNLDFSKLTSSMRGAAR